MSIEIEVGLENAAKVKPTMEELKLELPRPKGLANPKTRRLLFAGGFGGAGGGGRALPVLPQPRKHR